MNAPLIARIVGVLFLIAGIAGFLPYVTVPMPFDAQVVTLDRSYGMLAYLFPVNAVHDGLHIVFGLWGLIAARRFAKAVTYCRAVTWVYAVLIVLGLIPITDTLFGVAPIYGYDVALHAFILLLAAYGGYGRGSLENPL
ncbi:MAG: DUF4383 domain-containing protein [Vulcanimicrobiaceae bacterium]